MKVVRYQPSPVLLLIVACVLVFSSASWAGVTGKIAGMVTNKDTGEPIVNANVVVIGTLA